MNAPEYWSFGGILCRMSFLFAVPYMSWLVISAVLFALGEFLSKKFALAPSGTLIAALLVAYIISDLTWLPALIEKNQLSIVGAIWSVLSLITTVLIGVLVFGEELNTMGSIGILFGVVAITLLSFA